MACAVPANTAAWMGVTPGLAKIGMQSKSPMANAATVFSTQFGVSTDPARANFGRRSVSKMPQ